MKKLIDKALSLLFGEGKFTTADISPYQTPEEDFWVSGAFEEPGFVGDEFGYDLYDLYQEIWAW